VGVNHTAFGVGHKGDTALFSNELAIGSSHARTIIELIWHLSERIDQ
jgi:hypothetical protein